jgi:hypothetical protein
MKKFFSIICLVLFISVTLAKKSTTQQAVDAATDLKDKIVETVRCIYFLHSIEYYLFFFE